MPGINASRVVSGTGGGRRQHEHVNVTASTNSGLFVLIYSAALVFILNARQQSAADPRSAFDQRTHG